MTVSKLLNGFCLCCWHTQQFTTTGGPARFTNPSTLRGNCQQYRDHVKWYSCAMTMVGIVTNIAFQTSTVNNVITVSTRCIISWQPRRFIVTSSAQRIVDQCLVSRVTARAPARCLLSSCCGWSSFNSLLQIDYIVLRGLSSCCRTGCSCSGPSVFLAWITQEYITNSVVHRTIVPVFRAAPILRPALTFHVTWVYR